MDHMQAVEWIFETVLGRIIFFFLAAGSVPMIWLLFGGKRRLFQKLDERQAKRARGLPVKAKVKHTFWIGFWTDPKDGKRKQIWIPDLWLEYEDGAVKPLEIEGLPESLTRFGPITYQEPPPEQDTENKER